MVRTAGMTTTWAMYSTSAMPTVPFKPATLASEESVLKRIYHLKG